MWHIWRTETSLVWLGYRRVAGDKAGTRVGGLRQGTECQSEEFVLNFCTSFLRQWESIEDFGAGQW